MNIYAQTLCIPHNEANQIAKWLEVGGQSENYTYTQTVKFPNGIEADIKCCGSDEESSWTEMVLFNANGGELTFTEPEDEYLGKWEIEYNGDIYKVSVEEEPLCWNCAYVGDSKSFPQPNNKVLRHYYCNCGDCEYYNKDITSKAIHKCEYFEEV